MFTSSFSRFFPVLLVFLLFVFSLHLGLQTPANQYTRKCQQTGQHTFILPVRSQAKLPTLAPICTPPLLPSSSSPPSLGPAAKNAINNKNNKGNGIGNNNKDACPSCPACPLRLPLPRPSPPVPPPSPSYISCVTHYGPNNQANDFFRCALLARLTNRTLVLPPLFQHYTDSLGPSSAWFNWVDYFDVHRFRYAPVIRMEEYIRLQSRNKSAPIFDCFAVNFNTQYIAPGSRRYAYYHRYISPFIRHWPLKAAVNGSTAYERLIHIKGSKRGSSMNSHVLDDKNCRSVLFQAYYYDGPELFVMGRWRPNELAVQQRAHKELFKEYHRSPIIRAMATAYWNGVRRDYRGGHFAVVHWRRGDIEPYSLADYIAQGAAMVATAKRPIKYIYIMTNVAKPSDIMSFQAAVNASATSAGIPFVPHCSLLARPPLMSSYLWAMVEQEIATQADVFLGVAESSYSRTVMLQRFAQRGGAASLTHQYTHTGLPKPWPQDAAAGQPGPGQTALTAAPTKGKAIKSTPPGRSQRDN